MARTVSSTLRRSLSRSSPTPRRARGGAPSREPERGEATPGGLLPDTLSDRGNAKLFVKLYANDYRHVPGLGWFRWDATRWQIDEDDTVLWAAGDLAESLATTDPRGVHTSSALQQHRRRALSTSGMNAMLAQARTAPGMVLNAALLDADPYALCTPAGIVDLRTGLIRRPDPDKHFHSRSTTAAPQTMPTPRWHRFLADTFGEGPEEEMVDFLHLLLGYSVTGDVGGQVMPFLFGSGRNGKSVLLDVVIKLLGDYADAAPPGFLMARPYEGHPTDLAELHGRRVIVCSEVKPGDRFDEARVKLLTGGDRIKARRMRQDFFSFEPTHKLWLLGNHRPEVGTGGFAFWRRMRLVPVRAGRRPRPEDRQPGGRPGDGGGARHPALADRGGGPVPQRREGPHRSRAGPDRHVGVCGDRGPHGAVPRGVLPDRRGPQSGAGTALRGLQGLVPE
ncbi:phage/plasmid primase, P4 family [Actinomadura keratinilytica]